MNNIYLSIIVSFLINSLILTLFDTLRLSSKIIVVIAVSCLIKYLFYKNNEKIDLIENYFVSIMFILFLIYLIYKIIETIYIYGINNTKSKLIILFMIFSGVILINLYMYNNSFQLNNK